MSSFPSSLNSSPPGAPIRNDGGTSIQHVSAFAAPTMESHLATLTHLPSGMVGATRARAVRASRTTRRKLKDCQIVSKSYNTVASRPINRVITRNQIYHANLRLDAIGIFTTSTSIPTYYGQSFSLNDFADRTIYTGCFDQYRIMEFELWLEPQVSQSSAIANVGTVSSAIDLDDATVPLSIDSVEGKQNALTTGALDGHYHRWKPHMAIAAYSGVFTSFASVPAGWIDSASPSVAHYGVKYAARATSAAIVYNVMVRARVEFRQAGI